LMPLYTSKEWGKVSFGSEVPVDERT
jgi:hypothetical protein